LSPFSNITDMKSLGAAAAKGLVKPGVPVGVAGAGSGGAAGPSVSGGFAPGSGIRSAQAGLIAKLKQVNQAINVIQALEGESSALNDMLGKIESMIKQGSKNLVAGEKSAQKSSLNELVKDLMKGINAPVYADVSNYDDKQQILAYIGKGFSVDLVEGGIVFDVNKMLEDVYKNEQEQERQDKKRTEYRKAMGFAKGGLEKLMNSLTAEISKAGGLTYILNDIAEANGLSENIIAKIRKESSMLSMSYGKMNTESVIKHLNL
jgi:hypothetical protein